MRDLPESDAVSGSLPGAYFDALYARSPDPWSFETSEYELAKYQATLSALPHADYASALEIGCSIGVLTLMLAPRCKALLAMDPARRALERARARCAGQPHIRLVEGRVPEDFPNGIFDLILLSEVIYYLDADDVGRLAERVTHAIAPGGNVELVHWVRETDYPLSGDEATEIFLAATAGRLRPRARRRTPDYRLDLLEAA